MFDGSCEMACCSPEVFSFYIFSPLDIKDKEASSLCNGVQSQNQDVRSESLKKLAAFSADVTFAQEFISRDGLRILATTVEEQKE